MNNRKSKFLKGLEHNQNESKISKVPAELKAGAAKAEEPLLSPRSRISAST
jgi:hypothetical protein